MCQGSKFVSDSDCGHSKESVRINGMSIIKDILGFLHLHIQIPRTILSLILSPGRAVNDYIDTGKTKMYKPFSFLLFLAGLEVILVFVFKINFPDVITTSPFFNILPVGNIKYIYNWIDKNYSIFQVLIIPLFSLSTSLVFRNYHWNFFEHMSMHAYIGGIRSGLNLILIFTLLFLDNTGEAAYILTQIFLIGGILVTFVYLTIIFQERIILINISKSFGAIIVYLILVQITLVITSLLI